MSIGIALGGLVSGLNAGAQLGNGIMDRRHRADREAVADQRYKDKIDRQVGLDARNSTLQDAQEKRSQSAFDMNKQQHEFTRQVRDAGNLIDAYKSNGNKALAGMIKNTEKGQQMMQAGGFDDVEFQHTTGEDGTKTWYALGMRKGKDGENDTWGLINQDGQMAGENDQPMALGARGLYALGMHTMDISEEAANAAVAAAGKTQDNKRAAYATGRRKQADVMAKQGLVNKGKLDVANVKAGTKKAAKPATSSEMRKLRSELGDSSSLSKILTSTLNGESLPDNVIPYINGQLESRFNEGMSSEQIRQAVLADVKQRLIPKDGALYGKNFTFNDSENTHTTAATKKTNAPQKLKHADLLGIQEDTAKGSVKPTLKQTVAKPQPKNVGLSTPNPAIKKGVSVGVFKQSMENIRNNAKGYNDSVALARKIRSGEGAFKDFSDKQKADLLSFLEDRSVSPELERQYSQAYSGINNLPGKGDK